MNTNTEEINPGYNCRKCDQAITVPVDGLPREYNDIVVQSCGCSQCDASFFVEWRLVLVDNLVTYETIISY